MASNSKHLTVSVHCHGRESQLSLVDGKATNFFYSVPTPLTYAEHESMWLDPC